MAKKKKDKVARDIQNEAAKVPCCGTCGTRLIVRRTTTSEWRLTFNSETQCWDQSEDLLDGDDVQALWCPQCEEEISGVLEDMPELIEQGKVVMTVPA